MTDFIDLLVVNGDFVFDEIGNTELIDQRASIAQDVKHLLIESGILFLLLGERSRRKLLALKKAIINKAEEDERLRPGTVELFRASADTGRFILTGETFQYGRINLSVTL